MQIIPINHAHFISRLRNELRESAAEIRAEGLFLGLADHIEHLASARMATPEEADDVRKQALAAIDHSLALVDEMS